MKAEDKYDYVGIGLAYRLAIATYHTAQTDYSITLSSGENSNYWQTLGNAQALCTDLWKAAGLDLTHNNRMKDEYLENRRMHKLFDFEFTSINPLEPSCLPYKYCPSGPGKHGTFDSRSLQSSEDCEAQDFGKMAGLGYNIITGSPMASNDQGYKTSPVFKPKGGYEINASPETKQDGCPLWKWRYPKGYSVQTSYKLNAATSTGSMYSEKSYQQYSATRVSSSVQGSYVGASFGFTGS